MPGPRLAARRRTVEPSERVDRKVAGLDELLGLGPGEDPGGGPDGADATGPDGAGELEAFELGEALDQAGDVAGVEGVAAAGPVDVGDRVGAEAGPEGVGDDDRALAAPGDDDPAGPQVAEGEGLAGGVGLAQDQGRLVGVGQEDVDVREDRAEQREVVAGPGRGDVEDRDRPAGPGPGEPLGEGLRVEPRQDQEAADVDDLRPRRQRGVEVLGREPLVGAEGVDEPAVLPLDVDDQALAGRPGRGRPRAPGRRPRARRASRRRIGRRRRRPPGRRPSTGRPAWPGRPRRSRRSRRCSGSARRP